MTPARSRDLVELSCFCSPSRMDTWSWAPSRSDSSRWASTPWPARDGCACWAARERHNRGGAQTRGSQMSAVRLQTARATSLLILSPRAGSMNPDVESKIRKAFDASLIVEFDPRMDLDTLITRTATVIVSGGAWTSGWVVRCAAYSKQPA